MECFSQQKDELVLYFYLADGSDFYIKADLHQGVCLLTFPAEFHRSRSNSADLFPEMIGATVLAVDQTLNDRSFHLQFGNGLTLCFKMYGNRSNLLVHNGLEVLNVFNHHLKKDLESQPPADRSIDQSKEAFLERGGNLKSLYPTFDKLLWAYWEGKTANQSLENQWYELKNIATQLESGPFLLCKVENEILLSFLPIGEVVEQSADPFHISNRLSFYYWQVNRFFKEKGLLTNHLNQEFHKANQAKKHAEKLWLSAQEAVGYRLQADLLMAYGHDIKKGTDKTSLPGFEDGKLVEIKLKKDLSVLENAERLYKKAKGQDLDTNRLAGRVSFWESEMSRIGEQLSKLAAAQKWIELKPFEAINPKKAEEPENQPYHTLFFVGYEIWVGKNAKANDEILRLAHKDDLWLHARDVAGSHVIIRNKKVQNIPLPVKERAAQLAAFFSKAKTEALCPVMITERKYVRKIKGTAAGQVKVEREKTMLAEPIGLPAHIPA